MEVECFRRGKVEGWKVPRRGMAEAVRDGIERRRVTDAVVQRRKRKE